MFSSPLVLPLWLRVVNLLLRDTDGRDKLLKIFQYLLRFVSILMIQKRISPFVHRGIEMLNFHCSHIPLPFVNIHFLQFDEYLSHFDTTAVSISSCRRVIRLLKWIYNLQSLVGNFNHFVEETNNAIMFAVERRKEIMGNHNLGNENDRDHNVPISPNESLPPLSIPFDGNNNHTDIHNPNPNQNSNYIGEIKLHSSSSTLAILNDKEKDKEHSHLHDDEDVEDDKHRVFSSWYFDTRNALLSSSSHSYHPHLAANSSVSSSPDDIPMDNKKSSVKSNSHSFSSLLPHSLSFFVPSFLFSSYAHPHHHPHVLDKKSHSQYNANLSASLLPPLPILLFNTPSSPLVLIRFPWFSFIEFCNSFLSVLTDVFDDCEWISRYSLFPLNLGKTLGKTSIQMWFTTVIIDLFITGRAMKYKRNEIIHNLKQLKSLQRELKHAKKIQKLMEKQKEKILKIQTENEKFQQIREGNPPHSSSSSPSSSSPMSFDTFLLSLCVSELSSSLSSHHSKCRLSVRNFHDTLWTFVKFLGDLGCAMPSALNVMSSHQMLVQTAGIVSGVAGVVKLSKSATRSIREEENQKKKEKEKEKEIGKESLKSDKQK